MSAQIGQVDVQQLLIEGGYFRARITTISGFDLIAGGLAWCILNSRYSIDVEFIEESQIGHKIRVAENICNALKKDMNCPHDLRPHQIQGLDFPKLHVVLKWLLIRVQAAREEYATILASYVLLDFERRFGIPSVPVPEKIPAAAPRRQLRGTGEHGSPMEHINSVLLEYGSRYSTGATAAQGIEGEPVDDDIRRQMEEERKDMAAMDSLMAGMSAFKERQKLSGAMVGSLMAHGADAISAERDAFREKMRLLAEKELDVSAQKSRVETLGQEVAANTVLLEALRASVDAVDTDRLAPLKKELTKKMRKKQKIEDEIVASWDAINADPEKAEAAAKLVALMQQRAAFAQQSEAAAETHDNQLSSLRREVADLQADLDAILVNDASSQRDGDAETARATLLRLQTSMSKATREATETLRSLDALPTKAELLQYEKRFTELYSEVSWKYEETKQCFSRYNTISEKAATMKKEITLLHSVKSNYETLNAAPVSKATKSQQDELLGNIDTVVTTIREATEKQKVKLTGEREENEKVLGAYNAVLARQRSYFATLKALQNAVAKNEELASKATKPTL